MFGIVAQLPEENLFESAENELEDEMEVYSDFPVVFFCSLIVKML